MLFRPAKLVSNNCFQERAKRKVGKEKSNKNLSENNLKQVIVDVNILPKDNLFKNENGNSFFTKNSNSNNNNNKKSFNIKNNNIQREIEEIKSKQQNTFINYLDSIEISHEEHLETLDIFEKLTFQFSAEHVMEIKTTKKLKIKQKNILEIFCFLVNILFSDFKTFKQNLDYFSLKFKMDKFLDNSSNFSKNKINTFLNVLSNFNESYQEYESTEWVELLLNWIKAAIKIVLYNFNEFKKEKEKCNLNEKKLTKGVDSNFSSNRLTLENCSFSKIKVLEFPENNNNLIINPEDMICTSTEAINKKEVLQNNITPKLSYNTNKHNFLLTQIPLDQTNKHKKSFTNEYLNNNYNNINNKKEEVEDLRNTKEHVVSMNTNFKFNCNDIKKEKYNLLLQNVPFMKNKTFHQLRQYFHMLNQERNKINLKHFDDLEKCSSVIPKNLNSLILLINGNKLKRVEEEHCKIIAKQFLTSDYFG